MMAPLLDHLWQSTLFALLVSLAALALRHKAAEARFWLWFAAAAKFLIPFALITSAAAWLAAHLHAQAPAPPRLELARTVLAPIIAPVQAQPLQHTADIAPYLALMWAFGSVAIVIRRALQWRRLKAALAGAWPLALPSPLPSLEAGTRNGPAVLGFLRPVLLLPFGLTSTLTPAELEAVLEHELHHARRRDNLLTLPLLAAQALFWFHPLVWWIGRRMLAERERACDEAVVEGGIDAETYARGLLQVCRFQLEPPPAWAAAMTGADLQRRIRRIMADEIARPLGAAGRSALATSAAAILAAPVLAGVFVAPVMGQRLLTRLVQALPVVSAPPAAAPVAGRPRPLPVTAQKIVLSAQPAVLAPAAEPQAVAQTVRLSRRLNAPAFEPTPIASIEPAPAPVGAASPGLMQNLTAKTAYVVDDNLWGGRIELRGADACPAAQVARAERALGGETISTAFDGQVRHFVEDALMGRPAAQGLSPIMAHAVDARLPALQPALARAFANAGRASLLGEDDGGRDVYLVRKAGQASYVLVLVDDSGRIEAALFCAAGER